MGFDKILEPLGDAPVLAHSIRLFNALDNVSGIILAVQPGWEQRITSEIIKPYSLDNVTAVVAGGETRVHSVWNALQAVETEPEIIAVHDAARPFVSRSVIIDSIAAARKYGGAIVAVPVIPTIKEVDDTGLITRTLDRRRLRAAATPQVFKYHLFMDAFTRFWQSGTAPEQVTDDAQIVELAGGSVVTVDSNPENIKLTTPLDWQFARSCGVEWLSQQHAGEP
jgi:2-C-methyl-D-erythritol 4-phosphate cytidylyltransferase